MTLAQRGGRTPLPDVRLRRVPQNTSGHEASLSDEGGCASFLSCSRPRRGVGCKRGWPLKRDLSQSMICLRRCCENGTRHESATLGLPLCHPAVGLKHASVTSFLHRDSRRQQKAPGMASLIPPSEQDSLSQLPALEKRFFFNFFFNVISFLCL